jgi:hypothetical protein
VGAISSTRFVLDVGQGDVTSSPLERMTGQVDLTLPGSSLHMFGCIPAMTTLQKNFMLTQNPEIRQVA